MNILEFIYKENTISFNPTGNDDVMVNATEMAKAFGKRIDVFLKAEHVQEFIDALIESLNEDLELLKIGDDSDLKSTDEFPPNGGNSEPITRDQIIQTRGQNGTWMHRFLALEFAGWLDARFKVWVWKKIDKIILGHYREVKAATYEKLAAEKAVELKRKQLLKNNPEFVEFLALEGKLTETEKKRLKALKSSMDQFKLEFQFK